MAASITSPTSQAGGVPSLVMLADPRSAAAEAFRTLSTNVLFSAVDRPIRTLAVTSAGAGEGKSTTVANLAIALAESGRSVIVADADLRRPTLHTLFGLANQTGLTTALLDESPILPLQETAAPGVRLLASGPLPPNPAELLGSRRLDAVLDNLCSLADLVLFDTAPAGVLADAAIFARRVDGVLLVVAAGQTRRDQARQARESLERVNARVLGAVLTGVRADTRPYAY